MVLITTGTQGEPMAALSRMSRGEHRSITLTDGDESPALIPARYPGSEAAGDQFALGRETAWQDRGHECWHGQGQRLLVTESHEYSLLDIGMLTFNSKEAV